MGKLETFMIIFDHPQAVFYAGHVVSGHVHLVLNEAMKMRGVIMKLFGKGKVHWSVSSGKNRKHYRSDEIYFDCKVDLLLPERAGQESLVLPAGSYRYPFRLDLAASLPSSFEGQYGYVRYLASVKIDRPWKFDYDAKAAFTLLSNLDLNLEPPSLKEPFVLHETKDVGCCLCCINGLVDVTLTINRKCFVPGECIYISSKVINNSNSTIPNCSASLEQHINFLAHSAHFFGSGQYHCKTKKEVVAKLELPSIAAGETEERNFRLLVPSLPSSRLQGCQIININYFMVFDVNVDYTDCKLPIEVIIGTIPLRSQYPRAAVISTQPTASPRLPPQNFDPGSPPPPFPADSYDMPPPSYEECVSGKVTIREDTDSDYVRGNMNWAPVYPTYHMSDTPATE